MTDPLPYIDPFDDGRSPAHPATDMDEASSLIDAAFRFERAISRIGNARLRPWNMTLSSYTALRILANRPHLTLAQLSRRCYARPQTMTRIVTQLEKRGFVARGAHPESERALSLEVTKAGLDALEEMGTEVLKISDTLGAVLGRDEIVAADRQLRQAALVVEGELREMGRTEE
ncbi:MarR family transcriptional regulator [Amycolatopsis sp. SID8362]|uniref:MarR family winged helix-turn-helix transcriptional regulator n=1 Tax=Amycolatopsis sp. SID8362 TaxID=2690346 RepID=UPI0013681837|nr:MarR family transcriptional regulator [Amycolatopsis sp. SID8362]NBH11889.1 MarR family transcriptional regulator [Amycolatopsis sp. SID8362]NED48580.1 MarR family transcriptional regulator [Amycolatopsis sp. SID8362]